MVLENFWDIHHPRDDRNTICRIRSILNQKGANLAPSAVINVCPEHQVLVSHKILHLVKQALTFQYHF